MAVENMIFLAEKVVTMVSGIMLGLGLFMGCTSAINMVLDTVANEVNLKRNVLEFIVAGILIKIGMTF